MNRPTRLRTSLIALFMLASHSGCGIELDVDQDRPLNVTGKVTYQGHPVKDGAIHFLPVNPAQPPASGTIADGAIKDVFTRTPGDGIKPGKYKIAITSYDEDLLKSASKRTALGPDSAEVARAANNIKKLIPVRYSNVRESGLSAEFTQANHSLELELVD